MAWAARTGACIIEDDYDGEYRHDVAPIPPLRSVAPNSVIYVGTFSKTLSPTLRLGYLVVPAALRQAFAETKRLTDRHTALPGQNALADVLASGAYERHVRAIRRRNAERRAVLLQALADELGPTVTVVGAATGLHVVVWFNGIAAEREPALVAAAQLRRDRSLRHFAVVRSGRAPTIHRRVRSRLRRALRRGATARDRRFSDRRFEA